MSSQLLEYSKVLQLVPGDRHLLLGNGFSIACDPIFQYQNLFDRAVDMGLSPSAKAVFAHLGTNNFEGVLRLLEDSIHVAEVYGGVSTKAMQAAIAKDIKVIKTSLISVIAKSHLPDPKAIELPRRQTCLAFFRKYKVIFTTNYDLLPYWVSMQELEEDRMQDGFRAPDTDPNADHLVFAEPIKNKRGLLFLHGGLHLYVAEGETRKLSWSRMGKPITVLAKEGMEEGRYPIFVAEGAPEKKLAQINHNGYLSYVLGKFERIEAPLVIFGHSLGSSDRHILNAIAHNDSLGHVYVGVFGSPKSAANIALTNAANHIESQRKLYAAAHPKKKIAALSISFFRAESALPWG